MRQRFIVEQQAEITAGPDSAPGRDSVTSRAELVVANLAAARRIAGTVEQYVVGGPGRAPAVPAGLALPFTLSGDLSAPGRQVAFSAPASPDPCTSPAVAVTQSLRDLFFRPPDTLRIGATWSDTASYVVCRDNVPLHVGAQRAFRVAARADAATGAVLTVVRSARTRVAAELRRGTDTTRVAGTGSGELTYAVDAANSRILSARGTAQLELFVRGRVRAERVRQTSSIRITVASP